MVCIELGPDDFQKSEGGDERDRLMKTTDVLFN